MSGIQELFSKEEMTPLLTAVTKRVLAQEEPGSTPQTSDPFKPQSDALQLNQRTLGRRLQEFIEFWVELCPGLAAVGGVRPPEKVKGGVTQEVEERHCWPSSFVCVFVGKFGETV
ncbi:hypothetical protein MHYP_G00254250 [Metynnis hypsauchen]